MADRAEDFVALAVVTQPHGVNGRLKLKCFAEDLAPYTKQLTTQEGAPVTLRITSRNGEQCIVEVEGIKNRNEAELWRGKMLGVPRSALPAIAEDGSFYIHDLIGLRAQSPDGEAIGHIENVVNYGASDILIIRDADGAEHMVAFDDSTIPEIVIEAGFVVCDMPEILEAKGNKESAG